MSNIVKKKLSDEEQEKYILLAYINNDNNAKKILFEYNLGLVHNVINKYFKNVPFDEEDLFQVGSIGLWNAILNFDITLNLKLSTYASKSIWGEIKNYIRYNSSTLYIPRHNHDLYNLINKLKNEYLSKGKEISIKEISNILNIDEEEINLLINSNLEVISLQQVVFKNKLNDSSTTIEETIPNNDFSIEKIIEQNEIKNIIKKAIEKLDYNEQIIINKLFFSTKPNLQKMDLAKELGFGYYQFTRISRIALRKLKKILMSSENSIDLLEIRNRNEYKKGKY